MPDLDAIPEARRLPMRDPDPIRGGGELVENWLRYQGHDAQADKIAALLAENQQLRDTADNLLAAFKRYENAHPPALLAEVERLRETLAHAKATIGLATTYIPAARFGEFVNRRAALAEKPCV